MSKCDRVRNAVQAVKGDVTRAAGIPYAQAEGGAAKKQANLKQAGEKLKGHRQEGPDGLRR
jgi:5'-3' exonuclease